MEKKLFDQEWKEVWVVELNDSVFNLEVNKGLIHRYLVFQLANARQVVAHSKTRGEVRGSTRKIYKQKGTGRARMGGNRAPMRKGGWVVFGPRNTVNFTLSMNKKERRLALFHVLSSKAQSGDLVVLDALQFANMKTKNMENVLKVIPYEKTVLLALASRNETIEKSARNIPNIKTLAIDYLNVADLLKYKTLVLLKDSLEKVNALAQ